MSGNPYAQFFKKAQDVKRGSTSQPKPVQKKAKSRATFPWPAAAGLGVTLLIAGIYVGSPDSFERWIDKIEIRALGQAAAAGQDPAAKPGSSAAEKTQSNPTSGEKAAAQNPSAALKKSPADKSAVDEEVSQFAKLKQRKEELDGREKELTELEEELQRQKVELDKRITQLEEMRNQIAQTLKERVEVDQEKVNKLVDLYSNMKPKQAADIVGSLNEELAVEVLAKMKKKNAAEIMNLLPAEKARVLSEKYTGYRRISSQEPKG